MYIYHKKLTSFTLAIIAITMTINLQAQKKTNEFTIDAKMLTRGEIREGGFNSDSTDNKKMAHFILGQYQLNLTYKHSSWFEAKLSPKVTYIWGQSSADLNLSEAWILMKSKQGLFFKIGRQMLAYDDNVFWDTMTGL